MPLHLWLGLIASYAIVTSVPGPTVLLITTHAIGFGRRTASAMVLGAAAGGAVAIILTMAGLGALLATSATLFTVLKLFGAAYFVWLGVRLWRRNPELPSVASDVERVSSLRAFGHAFAVTALNPKGIAFYLLFLPLFLDAHAPLLPQMLVVVPTLAGVGLLTDGLYATFAVHMRRYIATPRFMRRINRAGASVLIALGVVTALHRAA